ncbi:hypothetical protein SK128_012505 [Halocaridina rubra]|uniref:Uncharacterized protein n=1 Tax=Halocaridina rubra TaxID=373956 RepID=A0AAN9FU24_HALRR
METGNTCLCPIIIDCLISIFRFCGRRKHEEVNSSTGELLVTAQNIRNRRGEKSGRFRCLVSSFLNFKHTVPGGNPIVGKPIVDKFPIGAFPGFPRPPMPQGVCSRDRVCITENIFTSKVTPIIELTAGL